MQHHDAIFSREEISPDGGLRIWYNYSDGEKTPTVIEPCVSVAATGEVLLDLWRTSINGSIDDFSPAGFRLTASDNYNQTQLVVRVALPSKTFTVMGDPTSPRSLANLEAVLLQAVESARQKRTDVAPSASSGQPILARIAGWFRG